MSSPVKIAVKDIISIDRRKSESIYLQIVYSFIQAVQRGILPLDAQLPGTRIFSQDLKIHRKTVVAAFEELQAQGWIETIPSVGSFVKNPQISSKSEQILEKQANKYLKKSDFNFKRSYLLTSPFEKSDVALKFNDGQPDYRLIDSKELARIYRSALQRKNIQQNITNSEVRVLPNFKEQLSYYLNLTRNLHISSQQLSIGKSKELLLYILTQLLIEPKDTVLIAGFGYFFNNMVFQQAGAKIISIPIDEKGMDIAYIKKNFKKGEIRCLIINTAQHYPSTQSFSAERKQALLALAEAYEFIIIEEDSEFEFHHNSTPVFPLISSNPKSNHIYLGSFGRFLTPSFQREFLIGPEDLILEVEKYLGFMDSKGDITTEQALMEMIKEGDIHRFLWKSNKVYVQRKQNFEQLLNLYLGNEISYTIPQFGLAFWIKFNRSISLNDLSKTAINQQLFIPRICFYQNKDITAMRLGFGHLNEGEMEAALKVIANVLQEITP